jgi:hypothetical protein
LHEKAKVRALTDNCIFHPVFSRAGAPKFSKTPVKMILNAFEYLLHGKTGRVHFTAYRSLGQTASLGLFRSRYIFMEYRATKKLRPRMGRAMNTKRRFYTHGILAG